MHGPDKISIKNYYLNFSNWPVIDVRSPGEFKKGHIPGAFSIPLFSDQERAKVGTAYTRQSKEIAMNIGLKFVRPKLKYFIDESKAVAPDGKVLVHCWRGGMRSESFARHLSEHGFLEVYLLEGGYKGYRKHVHQFFEQTLQLHVLGGFTGSGKTKILNILKENNCEVVDLEGIANHRGSAFGGINMGRQPTVEQFENDLFENMRHLNTDRPIWIEDESIHIGSVFVPTPLFNQIESQQIYFLNIPREERAKYLVQEYANLKKQELAISIQKIEKRLGFDQAKLALDYLEADDFYQVALITLKYYDKFYLRGLSRRDPTKIRELKLTTINHEENAKMLINLIRDEQN